MQLRNQMFTMQANLETLRTRVSQIADLRDAQGLREGIRLLWMTSMRGSELKSGTVIYLSKKVKKTCNRPLPEEGHDTTAEISQE